ncbi:MAG TPA: Gfo/Idh/MocA family oxidoreductase, partial [Desulfatiglandales bacterium]|nr:Gfo/Idh/MocA family oxidoreductase [Desulfatiglandales bacterium]
MTNQNNIDVPSVAVIGSGYWGKNLVRNFYQIGALKIICDKNEKIMPSIKKSYPDVEVTPEFSEVLEREDIKAVVIATPAETHYDFAKKAIQKGKHVFVEKPLALTERDGEELVKLAEEKQLTLMVGHILHYHPAILKLKELINSGEIGKIQYIYSNRLNIGKIRSEENILWSFAPHDISVILMLLEEMPSAISCSGGHYLQHNVEDVTMTTLDFPSGVKGHIFVSWLHPFKEQKLIVVGDKKMAVFDDVSKEKLLLYPHSVEWQHRQPVAIKSEPEKVPINLTEPLKEECQHFLDCISNGQQPKTDGKEALRVLRILNNCELSLREEGGKVQLDHASISTPRREHTKSEEEKYFIHESTYIDENVTIGKGTKIWHFSHILGNTKIGNSCNIGQNVSIGPDVVIGNQCKIQNNVSVYKGVTLEDEVFCGPSMVFTNVYNPRAAIPRMSGIKPTLVKKGTSIGA